MRTLIVEHGLASRQLLSGFLSAFGPCDLAVSGLHALELLHSAWAEGAPYQLVCLDVTHPVTRGCDVLGEIRRFERERGIPPTEGVKVILITVPGEAKPAASQDRQEACLAKPITRRGLLETLRALGLPAGEQVKEAEIVSGDVRRYLADTVATWMRQCMGKGPAGIKIRVDGDVITLVVERFMTPLEATLARREKNRELVPLVRRKALDILREELERDLVARFGLTVWELDGEVDLERDTQVIVVRLGAPAPAG